MKKFIIASLLCCFSLGAWAQTEIVVPISRLDLEKGNTPIGEIRISQSKHGTVFTPKLKGLKAGIYGFHIHENPSCAPAENPEGKRAAGMAAGGHWDPHNTKAHKGPWDDSGHLGDLPALAVSNKGHVQPVVAPRIKDINTLSGLSLMIHSGGDNYSDEPAALGGGGARMACGVIP